MEKETREREKYILVTENMYVISWEELKILNELISQSMVSYGSHTAEFFKLRSEVYNFIHER